MNIFFDSVNFYLSLRAYLDHSQDYNIHTDDRIKRDELITFDNGFYPMSLSKHIEALFQQIGYHCGAQNPNRITRDEFVHGYNQYDDASDVFYILGKGAPYLNLERLNDFIFPMSFYQIQDLMTCIYTTNNIALSYNGNANKNKSRKCNTPILLHSDISDNSIEHSFASCKDTDRNESDLSHSEHPQMSPISVTNSFNLNTLSRYPRILPTLDITNYTPPIQIEPSPPQTYSSTTSFTREASTHSIDLSNPLSDISNSIVNFRLPDPDICSLDISFSSSVQQRQKQVMSFVNWLCRCSLFSSCTRD
jgi:hypothetical protein